MTPTTGQDAPALPLAMHPFQRAGAWALAVMACRAAPREVTAADMDALREQILDDACTAGAVTDTFADGYDWWKVLFALYPNSKITHAGRRRDKDVLKVNLATFFSPDDRRAPGPWPCTFCAAPASHLWGKTMLPSAGSTRILNDLPPGVAGWPVCAGCRLAIWALPYGAWVTAQSATVMSCEDEAAERAYAAYNVARARRVIENGFGRYHRYGGHLLAMNALQHHTRLCGVRLYEFRNDNQEPWVKTWIGRRALPAFLATVNGNAPLRRGWRHLETALTLPAGKQGEPERYGPAEAARWLVEAEGREGEETPDWTLLGALHWLLWDTDTWDQQARGDLTALAFEFFRSLHGQAPEVEQAAAQIAEWIKAGHGKGERRDRLEQYKQAAQSSYRLGHTLHEAAFNAVLAGRPVRTTPEGLRPLVSRRPLAWHRRLLVAMRALEILSASGALPPAAPKSPREQEHTQLAVQEPILALRDGPVR